MFCQDKWLLRDLPWCDLRKVCLVGYFTTFTNEKVICMYLTLSFFDLEPYEAHDQVFLNETMEPWEFTMESFTDFLVWPFFRPLSHGWWKAGHLSGKTRGGSRRDKVVLRLLICLKRIAVEISMETCLLAVVCTIASEIASGCYRMFKV